MTRDVSASLIDLLKSETKEGLMAFKFLSEQAVLQKLNFSPYPQHLA